MTPGRPSREQTLSDAANRVAERRHVMDLVCRSVHGFRVHAVLEDDAGLRRRIFGRMHYVEERDGFLHDEADNKTYRFNEFSIVEISGN